MPGWKRAFQGGVHGSAKQPGCDRREYKPFIKWGPRGIDGELVTGMTKKWQEAKLQKPDCLLCCIRRSQETFCVALRSLDSMARQKLKHRQTARVLEQSPASPVGRTVGQGSRQTDYHKGTSS